MTTHNRIDKNKTLIWTDLEMSGLDPDKDVILEVAVIITDYRLNIIAETPPWAVHQPDAILDNMDKWNTKTHTESGLVERCRASEQDIRAVERAALKVLKKYANKHKSPMCGNSICQDRRFMARHAPQLESYFHYRNFDVSTLKIITQMRHPRMAAAVKDQKPAAHQALEDIRASIDEMRYYYRHLLVAPE